MAHLLFQRGHAFARVFADDGQGVEALVDHLVQVLCHQLAGTRGLAECQREALHLLSVAHGDVADVLQRLEGLLPLDAERHHRLLCLEEVFLVVDRLLAVLRYAGEHVFGGFGVAPEQRGKVEFL